MRVATRVVLLMGVGGLGMTRLFGGERGLPRLAPAVVVVPAARRTATPPVEPARVASPGSVSEIDAPDDTLALLSDSFALQIDAPDTALAPSDRRNEAPAPRQQPEPRREVDRPRRAATAPPAPLPPGRLFVSSRPWGQLYVDGALLGNTPASGVSIAPGAHQVRITREGFAPWDGQVVVEPGRDVRLIDIQLRRIPP
jgi:hypothetical protein